MRMCRARLSNSKCCMAYGVIFRNQLFAKAGECGCMSLLVLSGIHILCVAWRNARQMRFSLPRICCGDRRQQFRTRETLIAEFRRFTNARAISLEIALERLH